MAGAGAFSGGRGRELVLVDEAIELLREQRASGELPWELCEQLSDELIDSLLAGRSGEREILGRDGLLGELTRRLVERSRRGAERASGLSAWAGAAWWRGQLA